MSSSDTYALLHTPTYLERCQGENQSHRSNPSSLQRRLDAARSALDEHLSQILIRSHSEHLPLQSSNEVSFWRTECERLQRRMNALREYFALMHVDYEEMKREVERSRRQQFAGVIDTAQEKIDYSMRESDLIEENSSLRCRVDIAESQREHLKRKVEELEERSHDLESLLVEQVEKSRELVVRLEIAEQVRVRTVESLSITPVDVVEKSTPSIPIPHTGVRQRKALVKKNEQEPRVIRDLRVEVKKLSHTLEKERQQNRSLQDRIRDLVHRSDKQGKNLSQERNGALHRLAYLISENDSLKENIEKRDRHIRKLEEILSSRISDKQHSSVRRTEGISAKGSSPRRSSRSSSPTYLTALIQQQLEDAAEFIQRVKLTCSQENSDRELDSMAPLPDSLSVSNLNQSLSVDSDATSIREEARDEVGRHQPVETVKSENLRSKRSPARDSSRQKFSVLNHFV